MNEAYTAFEKNAESIESLIRATDIYCQHVLALSRSQKPDLALIEKIISQKGLSTLTWTWHFHMTPQEHNDFDQAGHLRRMCEHIVFASYVALESYLISKFYEYCRCVSSPAGEKRSSSHSKQCSFRSLDEIKRKYSRLLGIRLAAFEPDAGVFEEGGWFHPNSCWE